VVVLDDALIEDPVDRHDYNYESDFEKCIGLSTTIPLRYSKNG
jgi:hypothetical protein